MNYSDVFNSTKKIMVNELEMDPEIINDEKKLQDMGIDSIQLMTLVVYLEDLYNIEIEFDSNWPLDITSITLRDFISNIIKLI